MNYSPFIHPNRIRSMKKTIHKLVAFATCFFISCGCFGRVYAQAFPLGVQAALKQIIGEKSLSCQADYFMEYEGLKNPILFKLVFLNAADGCRFDVDLANGSPFTQEMAKKLAPFKADKLICILLNSSKKSYTEWPDLKMYCEQFILEDQLVFFQKDIKVVKKVISSENINGLECIKYQITFDLGKNTNNEAFVWLTKDQSALPVKIEMKAEDILGQSQKAIVFFTNWKQEAANNDKLVIPREYTKIRDIRDILPKNAEQSTSDASNKQTANASSPQAEFFKTFLVTPPNNIAELTFERINTKDNRTNIYTIKQQPNAIYFREVNTTDEINGIKQDPRKIIISRYGKDTWTLRNNMLFTSADPISKVKNNVRVDDMSMLQDVGQNILSEPLKMGILFSVFKTFKWNGNTFIADDKDGGQLSGHLLLDEAGWPKRVIYTREWNKISYQVDYKYPPRAESNAIPSEMSLTFANEGSYGDYVEARPYKKYLILSYKTSESQLPESDFSLEKFRKGIRPGGGIVYSNHVAYVINGKAQSLNAAQSQSVESSLSTTKARCLALFLMLVPAIIFLVVVIRNIQKNKQ